MSPTTLYIADDHQIVIDGIELLLESEPDLKIIGTANDDETACSDLLKLRPDIAIVDLRMPAKGGLYIIQALHKKIDTRFIVLTMQMDKRVLIDAENYGARAFLLKNLGKAELIGCIRKVINGEKHFPELKQPDGHSILSPRENDILERVLKGLTTVQISEELHLSPFTVETHRKNIYRKTGCSNLAMLISYARENGLGGD